MYKKLILITAAFALSTPALAITQIVSPDLAYRSTTTLIGVPSRTNPHTSWGDLDLTVDFSTPLEPRTVGDNWATWGSPPDTEQNNPRIWYTMGATSLTFTFSTPTTIWGFEAEPNPYEDRLFTVEYYQGATLLGTITETINGSAGARLLAAAADAGTYFTHVTVYTDSDDFAMAQLRYGSLVPEPATWALLIAGFGMVGLASRRRRSTMSRVSR